MSVQYRGKEPERNFCINDFYANGVVIVGFGIWRHHQTNKRHLSCTFKSNGLSGTIRTTCYGDTFAIDVRWGRRFAGYCEETCLTTECKTLREAKSILYVWFREKGFVVPKHTEVTKSLEFKDYQGTLSPFIFK
jgi:hypothetical protein